MIADEREVAGKLGGGNAGVRHDAELPAVAVVHRERHRVVPATRPGCEPKFRSVEVERQRARLRAVHVAEENRAVPADAGVESSAVDQAVAVVAQLTLDADAKAGRALSRADRTAVDAANAYAHVEVPGGFAEVAREHVDVAVWGGVDALDAAPGDLPILKRIGPVLPPEPHAVGADVPVAAERGRRLRGAGTHQRRKGCRHDGTRDECRGVRDEAAASERRGRLGHGWTAAR
jgi:hypothetical protein